MKPGTLRVAIAFCMTISGQAHAQKLVSCPNPLPATDFCIKSGEVFEVNATNPMAGGWNTLYMEDNSFINVTQVSQWSPRVGVAHIGTGAKIFLQGRSGVRGADGVNYDQGNEKPGYGSAGSAGRNGASGESGTDSPGLDLVILQLRTIGDLEIGLYPGAGGDGGNGGRGQPGGDANCQYRGGSGGPGGLPGAGGNGGRFKPVTVDAAIVLPTLAAPLAAPPRICETAICYNDPLTGKGLKLPKMPFDRQLGGIIVKPTLRHGVWFSCLDAACASFPPFENYGRGGRGGSWSEGGNGRNCVFYNSGGGDRGADNSGHRGPNGRPSEGTMPELRWIQAK